MITQPKIFLAIAFLAFLALSSRVTHGASITWDAPDNISGVGDVSTAGTLVGAANVGDTGVPSTTVNGVNFQSFAAPGGNGTSGMFAMTAGGGGVFNSNTDGASRKRALQLAPCQLPDAPVFLRRAAVLAGYSHHVRPERGDAVPVSILV